jgi:DNA-binding MarR family transcriptional regulator
MPLSSWFTTVSTSRFGKLKVNIGRDIDKAVNCFIVYVHVKGRNMFDNQYIADHCLCHKMRSVTRLITRRYDDALKPIGINSGQFTILVAVELTGPVSISELADALSIERTTLSRNLSPLENEGLLRLVSGKGRTRYVEICKSGSNLLEQARPIWAKTQQNMERDLGQDETAQLRSDLKHLKEQIR